MTQREKCIDVESLWKELETSDTPLMEIAKNHDLKRSTLMDRLQRVDRRRYSGIMRRRIRKARRKLRRRRRIVLPIREAWAELEKGKRLKEVAEQYGVDGVTLSLRLQRDDKNRYKDIIRQYRLPEVPRGI